MSQTIKPNKQKNTLVIVLGVICIAIIAVVAFASITNFWGNSGQPGGTQDTLTPKLEPNLQ
jgi:hypothetical protein